MNTVSPKIIAVIENGLFSTYTMRDGLMKRLIKEGHTVHVLTHSNSYASQVEKTGIRVTNIGSGNVHPVKVLKYIIRLYRALRRIRPDVVLTFSIRPAIWGNFITRHFQIPTITNITGTGPLFTSRNVAYRIARFVYRFALKKTSTVFFQNYDDMNLFLKNGFVQREQAVRIPGSGVDYEKFKPIKKTTTADTPFQFLFIGRLIKDKGIYEYIEAARIVLQNHSHVTFGVLGPFWHQNLKSNTISKEQLQSWIDEGLIEYKGEKKDVRADIAGADCIVLPSYREGTSNILLEAASMEKPAITCNVTGCKEIVDDGVTGFLAEVRNAVDLAAKMEKMLLLMPVERELLGKNARKKIIREYDKEIVITAYLDAIHSIFQKDNA